MPSVLLENRVHGVLAIPRVSRNNNFYLPRELMRADGKTVPFFLDHEDFDLQGDGYPKQNMQPRGYATLHWNPKLQRLEFDGEVNDIEAIRSIRTGERPYVSLAAIPQSYDKYRGVTVPIGLDFFSLSAVKDPGIPETNIQMERVAESVRRPVFVAMEMHLAEDELSSDERGNLDTSDFAYVGRDASGNTVKKLPIHDAAHVRNALARFSQTKGIPDSEKPKVLLKIRRAAKKFGIDVSDEGISSGMGGSGVAGCDEEDKPPLITPQPTPEEDHPGTLIPRGTIDPKLPDGTFGGSLGSATAGPGGVDTYAGPIPAATPVPKVVPSPRGIEIHVDSEAVQRDIAEEAKRSVWRNMRVSMENSEVKEGFANSAASQIGSSEMAQDAIQESARQSPRKVREAEGDAAGAQDKTTRWPKDTAVKSIGLPNTPYEEAPSDAIQPRSLNPNAMSTGGVNQPSRGFPGAKEEEEEDNLMQGTTGSSKKPGDFGVDQTDPGGEVEEEEDDADGSAEKPGSAYTKEVASYGFTKDDWSTLSKTERAAAIAAGRRAWESVQRRSRLEKSGVLRNTPIASRRESRAGGKDVISTALGPYNIEFRIGDLDVEEHYAVLKRLPSPSTKRIENSFSTYVPALTPPKVSRKGDIKPRLEFYDALDEQYDKAQYAVTEAITTSTSGAAIGVEEMTPALVVPTQLAALLRDTLLFKALPQGVDRARFQTITVPTPTALTQNTEPSQATQTLATVDVTTSPRGVEQQISFEAERRIIGPILEADILSFRLAELYDEDYLLVGDTGTKNYGTVSNQAFASAPIPTSGGVFGTGNQIFGTGVAGESSITNTMTMSQLELSAAQDQMKLEGYSPDNLVCVMSPKQFKDLTQDATIQRYLQWNFGGDQSQTYIAQGIIPSLFGFEIRQSTLVGGTSAGGSGGIPTYHAWCYKKGLTAAMAASRDVMIESFRDIRNNSTWLKGHWDLGINVLHPNSLIEVLTA